MFSSSRPLGPASRSTGTTSYEAGPNMLSGGLEAAVSRLSLLCLGSGGRVKLRMCVGARLQGEEFIHASRVQGTEPACLALLQVGS